MILSCFCLLNFYTTFFYALNCYGDDKQPDYYYVNECYRVNLRSHPNLTPESIKIRKIEPASRVKIIGEIGGWYKVETTDDFQTGYIKKSLLISKLPKDLIRENTELVCLLETCENKNRLMKKNNEKTNEVKLENKMKISQLQNRLLESENRNNDAKFQCAFFSVVSFCFGLIVAFFFWLYCIKWLKKNGETV